MPRITEPVAYGFAVNDATLPVIDQNDGQPIRNGHGEPKTQPGKILTFVDPRAGDQIRVAFSLDARDQLVQQLTGGVIMPELKMVRH